MLLIILCQLSTLSTSLELHPIVMVLVIISWRRDDTYRSIKLKFSFCCFTQKPIIFLLNNISIISLISLRSMRWNANTKTNNDGGLVADRGIDARGIFWQLTFFWGTPHWVRDQVVSWQLPEKLVHFLEFRKITLVNWDISLFRHICTFLTS